jgi:hypothetical protein
MAKLDFETLRAALVGYQEQRDQIVAKMEEIRRRIGGKPATFGETASAAPAARRTLSAAARRRIAAAQKKRWAAYHSEHGKPSKPARKKAHASGKRKLSPEGRQRIVDALKKRWAAAKKQSAA